jgi:cysteine desulfurase
MTTKPIYLDYNATTPVDPRVLEAMLPYFTEAFGNAASRHHALGCRAATAVETARAQVAAVIGADPREIVFTSGATESNNLAIKGFLRSNLSAEGKQHIVTVKTEHKAVLDACEHLQLSGCDITYLPVDHDGCIDPQQIADAITDRTALVTIMHANNEIGVLHDIETIGQLCKERGVIFHTDATQSFGKEKIDVEAFGIDLLSLSAHKFYGPKGVGALYVRRKRPRVRLEPLMHGGGHERGLRSGTLNVPGIIGLGTAATICQEAEQARTQELRDTLEAQLMERVEGTIRNGHPTARLANTCNLSFAHIDAEVLMKHLPQIAVSTSSACTSASLQPSYVLGALGASDEQIRGSVRFSLGRFTTQEEISETVEAVARVVTELRADGSAAQSLPTTGTC